MQIEIEIHNINQQSLNAILQDRLLEFLRGWSNDNCPITVTIQQGRNRHYFEPGKVPEEIRPLD